MTGVRIFLNLENSERPELKFDKKYNIKVIETGEDYRTERWYHNVEIKSVDRYFIRLRRLNCNSKQDPYPKAEISKIVEVNEVEND